MLVIATISCSETRDLGSTNPHGLLPVDERNPIVIMNDGAYDNWQAEYAILLANSGGPKLAGIIVSTGGQWMDLDTNFAAFNDLVGKARSSGLQGIPDPVASNKPPLVRPMSGKINDTTPNQSPGAQLILDSASQFSLPYRPLVVATGGRLTDVADAYLIDQTLAERIVVVSSLGSTTDSGGAMAAPNGEMDPWADAIVAARLRFVQVSAFYDQAADVPASRLPELLQNPFGDWIRAKQSKILGLQVAADQVSVIAVGIVSYSAAVQRVAPVSLVGAGATAGPDLVTSSDGNAGWLVRQSASTDATARFWQALQDLNISQPSP